MRRSSAGYLDAAGRLSDLGDRYLARTRSPTQRPRFGARWRFRGRARPRIPGVADSMTALADVRAERRDSRGAESLYQRALAVNETAYGPDDARLASPLANLPGCICRGNAGISHPSVSAPRESVRALARAEDFHVAMTLDQRRGSLRRPGTLRRGRGVLWKSPDILRRGWIG